MLLALLDGRALTATELAYAAGVTPQTASSHLGKLTKAGLLSVVRVGRHRYFRLASMNVVNMIDGIATIALDNRPRFRPLSRQARELSAARVCYDHLAGRLGVGLADFFIDHGYILPNHKIGQITDSGSRFLGKLGIDVTALAAGERQVCRLCLDWTERRPHIGGAVGAALASHFFDIGWTERMKGSRAVIVTVPGKRGFLQSFGIQAVAKTADRPRGK